MDKQLETFDKIFAHRGGVENFSGYPNRMPFMKNILSYANQGINNIKQRNAKAPSVYINYISNSTVNAVATKFEGEYYIGIHTGTVVIISELFYRILSSPNVLSEWGDISKESETQKILNAQLTDLGSYYIAKNPDEDIIPKDISRKILSELLTLCAMNFLILHEYGHIINGHCDFRNSVTSNFSYSEKGETSGFDLMILQTLEMDADAFATVDTIYKLIHYFDNPQTIQKGLEQYYTDICKSVSLSVFSIYSFFRIFGWEKYNVNHLESYDHPPTPIRQRMFMSTVAEAFKYKKPEILNKILDIIEETVLSVENAFDEISEQGFDLSPFSFAFLPESEKHLEKIVSNWNNVEPLLEPFAMNKLTPVNRKGNNILLYTK